MYNRARHRYSALLRIVRLCVGSSHYINLQFGFVWAHFCCKLADINFESFLLILRLCEIRPLTSHQSVNFRFSDIFMFLRYRYFLKQKFTSPIQLPPFLHFPQNDLITLKANFLRTLSRC